MYGAEKQVTYTVQNNTKQNNWALWVAEQSFVYGGKHLPYEHYSTPNLTLYTNNSYETYLSGNFITGRTS